MPVACPAFHQPVFDALSALCTGALLILPFAAGWVPPATTRPMGGSGGEGCSAPAFCSAGINWAVLPLASRAVLPFSCESLATEILRRCTSAVSCCSVPSSCCLQACCYSSIQPWPSALKAITSDATLRCFRHNPKRLGGHMASDTRGGTCTRDEPFHGAGHSPLRAERCVHRAALLAAPASLSAAPHPVLAELLQSAGGLPRVHNEGCRMAQWRN